MHIKLQAYNNHRYNTNNYLYLEHNVKINYKIKYANECVEYKNIGVYYFYIYQQNNPLLSLTRTYL